jgi:hypothetical protein
MQCDVQLNRSSDESDTSHGGLQPVPACTLTRPRTAHAASNLKHSLAARPQSARHGNVHSASRHHETWLPAGKHSIPRIVEPQRPASAGACPAGRRATLARLKAELAAVASAGNLQLQSLSPVTVPVDASAELQVQVGLGSCRIVACETLKTVLDTQCQAMQPFSVGQMSEATM